MKGIDVDGWRNKIWGKGKIFKQRAIGPDYKSEPTEMTNLNQGE